MRVLVVTNDLPPRVGGIQYYVDQLCRGLVDAGDEVVLFGSESPGWRDHDAVAPYGVVREPTEMLLPTPTVRRHLLELAGRMRAEVAVFGAAFPLGALARPLRRAGVPSVGFTHGLEVTAVRAPGGRSALRFIGDALGAVTYVSTWCRDSLRPAFGPRPEHVMLPPAVDLGRFNSAVDGRWVRRRHGIGEDPLVVCVSRLVERKGQDRLIDCLPGWRAAVPGTRLMIVGDGPFAGELRSRADRAGVQEWVTFTGQVPEEELPAHFAAADVFAMPCRERRLGLEVEAFGIVFIQSQAVGVPVVAGNIGGVPDAVRDGRTGLLVDGTDVSQVGAAVESLLRDDGLRATMGRAGADWVAAGFGWEQRTGQLRTLLEHLRASRATR